MNNCPFCRINKDLILTETHSCLAFYDKFPVSKGHILIIPKLHESDYFRLSQKLKSDLWELTDTMKDFADKKFSPDGYNIGINISESAGQTVFHCHIHLIPRYYGDVEIPEGGVRGVIPNKQKYK